MIDNSLILHNSLNKETSKRYIRDSSYICEHLSITNHDNAMPSRDDFELATIVTVRTVLSCPVVFVLAESAVNWRTRRVTSGMKSSTGSRTMKTTCESEAKRSTGKRANVAWALSRAFHARI